jgi:hypothetical protein
MAPDRPEVLTSLPRSRPTRRSAKRGAANNGDAAATEAEPKTAAKAKPKPKAKAKPKSATAAKKKPATAAKAKPKAKPAAKPKPKPKAKAAAKPTTAAKPKAKAAPKRTAKRAALKDVSARRKPEPVSSASPGLDEFPKEPPSGPVDPPSGSELLQSAAKAAGEIAQAGITVGREALKSVTKRLPRP